MVVNTKWYGNATALEVWETIIRLALSGRCRALRVVWWNLGNLLRKRMLPRVRDILFGATPVFFFTSLVLETARRGVWNGCRLIRLPFCPSRLYMERTPSALNVLLGSRGGRTAGSSRVSTDPLDFGEL